MTNLKLYTKLWQFLTQEKTPVNNDFHQCILAEKIMKNHYSEFFRMSITCKPVHACIFYKMKNFEILSLQQNNQKYLRSWQINPQSHSRSAALYHQLQHTNSVALHCIVVELGIQMQTGTVLVLLVRSYLYLRQPQVKVQHNLFVGEQLHQCNPTQRHVTFTRTSSK